MARGEPRPEAARPGPRRRSLSSTRPGAGPCGHEVGRLSLKVPARGRPGGLVDLLQRRPTWPAGRRNPGRCFSRPCRPGPLVVSSAATPMSMFVERRVGVELVESMYRFLRLDRGRALPAGLRASSSHRRDRHREDDRLAQIGDRGVGERRDRDRDAACRPCSSRRSRRTARTRTVRWSAADLELLAGHAERRRQRTLGSATPIAAVAATLGHHHDGEPLPSGAATSQGLHDFPPSRTYISGRGLAPGLGWEKCYVLGKESAVIGERHVRRASESSAITPERQPMATLSRNLLDRTGSVRWTKTPLSRSRLHITAASLGGDPTPTAPTGCRAKGMDRAWPIVVHSGRRAQGASLLASNGPGSRRRRPHSGVSTPGVRRRRGLENRHR